MTHYYSDPEREHDNCALPDVEVFYANGGDWFVCDCGATFPHRGQHCDQEYAMCENGYYYWFCFPGCMPESEPVGPFETESAALDAMRAACDQ